MTAATPSPTLNLASFLRHVPGLCLLLDPELVILDASDAYLAATMTTRAGLVGKHIFTAFPDNPDDAGATGVMNLRSSLAAVLATGKPHTMGIQKYDIRKPAEEGGQFEERYWAPVNAPVLDDRGQVSHIVHYVEDVTSYIGRRALERKALGRIEPHSGSIEQELNSIRHVLDQSAIVSITDRAGTILHANERLSEISGYSREELVGANHRILNSGHHPRAFFETLWSTVASGRQWEGEIRNAAKDGSPFWVHTKIHPLLDDRGRPYQYVAVRFDITARKLAEEQLATSKAQVQQLQKMDAIGALAGGLAHDFNNLLGAIKMYCDLLDERAVERDAVKSYSSEIRLVTDRGAALTRQLLVFSRKQIVQTRPIDLNSLITAFSKLLERLIGEHNSLVTKLASEIGLIKGDPGQIEQVIMNLVVNARDAMPNGGSITIETERVQLGEDFAATHLRVTPGAHVALTVTDTGCGMSAETRSRLFEPFFTTKEIGKGTGLGLPTVYGIVKQFNGSIWVYSEVGRGTVFKIYFPVLLDASAPIPAPTHVGPARAEKASTILLVEDEERLRSLYAQVIERSGHRVYVAGDGQEALEIIDRIGSRLELLLTDVVMPRLGGIELARRAIQKLPRLKVLYMSGYADDPSSKADYLRDLSGSFIQKPFDTAALLAKVSDALKGDG